MLHKKLDDDGNAKAESISCSKRYINIVINYFIAVKWNKLIINPHSWIILFILSVFISDLLSHFPIYIGLHLSIFYLITLNLSKLNKYLSSTIKLFTKSTKIESIDPLIILLLFWCSISVCLSFIQLLDHIIYILPNLYQMLCIFQAMNVKMTKINWKFIMFSIINCGTLILLFINNIQSTHLIWFILLYFIIFTSIYILFFKWSMGSNLNMNLNMNTSIISMNEIIICFIK